MNHSENRDHKDPEKRPSLFAARSRNLWESLLPVLILIGMILILTVGWDLFVAKESQKPGIFFKAENIGNIFRHWAVLELNQ